MAQNSVCKSEEVDSWNFEPSQPQRITSGLKQTSIHLLFTLHTSHQTTNSPPKNTNNISPETNLHITRHTDVKHKIFKELVPLVLVTITS